MVKRKCSDTLYTKSYWSQAKEVLIMAIVHNLERKMVVVYVRMSMKLEISISTKEQTLKFYSPNLEF